MELCCTGPVLLVCRSLRISWQMNSIGFIECPFTRWFKVTFLFPWVGQQQQQQHQHQHQQQLKKTSTTTEKNFTKKVSTKCQHQQLIINLTIPTKPWPRVASFKVTPMFRLQMAGGWLAGWLAGGWLAGGWLAGWWLAGWLVGWLAGGWLAGWLAAGWLAGWLVAGWRVAGWLAGGWLVPLKYKVIQA